MAPYAGVAAGSVVVGPVIERAGFRSGFAVAAGVPLLSAAAFHRAASGIRVSFVTADPRQREAAAQVGLDVVWVA